MEISRFQGANKMRDVIKLYIDNCGPCMAVTNKLNNLNIPHTDMLVNEKVAEHFGIRSVPVLVFLEDGVEVGRLAGMASDADIEKMYKGE